MKLKDYYIVFRSIFQIIFSCFLIDYKKILKFIILKYNIDQGINNKSLLVIRTIKAIYLILQFMIVGKLLLPCLFIIILDNIKITSIETTIDFVKRKKKKKPTSCYYQQPLFLKKYNQLLKSVSIHIVLKISKHTQFSFHLSLSVLQKYLFLKIYVNFQLFLCMCYIKVFLSVYVS